MTEGWRRSEKNINYVIVPSFSPWWNSLFIVQIQTGRISFGGRQRIVRRSSIVRSSREFICTTNSASCGKESHLPDESADGQLALGMTGGRTLSNNKGRPPPMLGLRCGIDALDEACDGSTGSCANCFSNLANSSSSCAISRRYTRFCTSTRYWSSLSRHEMPFWLN